MADFPSQGDLSRLTVHSASSDSLGPMLAAQGFNFATSAAWPSANEAIFVPFVVRSQITAVKLYTSNGFGTVSGNVDCGIYTPGGVRMVSIGSTAQVSANISVFDITDTVLSPGVYYFGLACDNTTGRILVKTPATVAEASALGLLSMASAFPLPATATFAAAARAFIPAVGLTTRATM